MSKKSITFIFFMLTIVCFSQKLKNERVIAPKEIFVSELMAKMTLEEKIGQLNLPASGDLSTGQTKNSNVAKSVKEGKVGGLFNIKSVEKINAVQRIAVEDTRLKIPLLIGMDVIHGYETIFPIPLGLSCSWNMKLIERSAQIAAKEATADGINWTFSPMVDLSRDPRWGRVSEGSGEDPFLGAKIAKAMVKGYQGTNLADKTTLLSCMKHFALYGATEAGREYNTVDMSRVRMFNEYFLPYKAAVDAGAASVMTAFNEVDGIPASGNKWLMTDILRKRWNFKGFVVTDYTAIQEMTDHGLGDMQTVSALAINAGVEIDMVSEGFLTTLPKSVEEGKISLSQIDEAVRKILNAKYDLGLFHNPYTYSDEARVKTDIFTKEHRQEARKTAVESFVLLKNENQLLPLKKSGTIALIGPLADAKENMAGTWTLSAKQDNSISVLKGLQDKVGKSGTILYAKGSNIHEDAAFEELATMFGKTLHRDNRTTKKLLEEALKIANQADVIVAALGESAEMSGESSSRTDIEIPQVQKELLQALLKTGKPVVLLLFNGRPLVIQEENTTVQAILEVWFGGSETGNAIADVLFGDENPSGKLTMSFPRNVGQIPIYYNHKKTGRPQTNADGKFEKYRSNYLDSPITPLFPFGFGLSYTTFSYANLKIENDKLAQNETLAVSVEVTNSGNFDGKEVVQLYLRDLVGTITRPVKELKGFEKIFLKKGETKTVNFELSIEDLKFYNSDLEFVAELGEFEVFVGTDSTTEMKRKFVLF